MAKLSIQKLLDVAQLTTYDYLLSAIKVCDELKVEPAPELLGALCITMSINLSTAVTLEETNEGE